MRSRRGARSRLKDVVIIGAGGFGRELADTVASVNAAKPTFRLLGFIDDNPALAGREVNGVPVIGDRVALKQQASRRTIHSIIAVAGSEAKRRIVADLEGHVLWERLLHPFALVSPSATLGAGVILREFVVIAANAVIGNHCMVNANSGLGHDTRMGDYSSVMTHCDVTGGASLGAGVFLGTGARILPGIQVGDGAFIGAGSVVMKDVEAGAKILGNPARVVG